MLSRSRRLRHGFVLVAVLVSLPTVSAFVLDVGATDPEPVPFEETTAVGLAAEERLALDERGLTVPRVQVFYSQYQYVVGYRGVESAVDAFQQPAHERQFGQPLAASVEAIPRGVELTGEGYLRTDGDGEWIDASEALFVVGSEARTPAGETAVPFDTESGAAAFAAEYGGEVLGWAALQSYDFAVDGPAVIRDRVAKQRASADERVVDARARTDREVSVVVGEDAPTVQAAVDAAPPETAVLIPEGTYEEDVVVDRPVTLRGENATVRGDGNGSVITVESDGVGVVGVDIAGVGNRTRAEEGEAGEGWDEVIETGYAHGDAAVLAANVSGTYVADVSIRTPANGILFRDASDSVVEGVTVEGPDEWREGFMSVNAIRSPVVVQHSTFEGNRDGIYLHRGHGTVVRGNTFRDNRFGVHFMYTSDSLIADNVARGQGIAGITIMTTPTRNAVVGNDVRNASSGIIPGGSRSYVAENVVAYNERGMTTGATQSLYERNVVYGNEVGIRSGTVQPSNRVVENDFVANERHAVSGVGPLRVWTRDGTGNYWEGADRRDRNGRSYAPTAPIDGRLHRVDGTVTLAEAPARRALDAVRDTTPGMRRGEVVDTVPLTGPVNPDVVAELAENGTGPTGERDDD